MKQHITVDQLRGLPIDKASKLTCVKEDLLKRIIESDDPYYKNELEDLSKGVTIGKLLEIIDELPDYYEIILHRGESLIIKMRRKFWESPCICDCLLKAVKEML